MARTKAFDKEEILEKAMKLFWKKGFHGTSIQDLVDHLGINRSSMYASFGDKNQLFLEALKHYRAKEKTSMGEYMQKNLSLGEFLDSFLTQLIQNMVADPERKGCFIVNTSVDLAPHDDAACKLMQVNHHEFTASFAAMFNGAIAAGQLPEHKDPEQLADFLYNTVSGMQVIGRTKPDKKVLDNIKTVALQAVLN